MLVAPHVRQLVKACFVGLISGIFCTNVWAQPKNDLKPINPQAPPSLHGKYNFQSVDGVVASTSNTVRCGDVCDRISDFDSFTDVVRLKDGAFAAPRKEGDQWSWQVGSLSDVSRGRLDKWDSDARTPRWTPAIPGFVLKHVVPLRESTDVFVGAWEPDRQANGRTLVALFSDGDTRRIGALKMADACVIATVEAPVVAVSSEISLHGEMWPVSLIVRLPRAEEAGILGFVLFPASIKCQAPPGQ